MASMREKLSFSFYLILLNLHLNSHMEQVAILDSIALDYADSLYGLDFIPPRTKYKVDWFSKYCICLSCFGS